MKIYHHDESGYLIGQGNADADPLEAGRWLVPARAVTVAPPTVPDGQRAKWSGAGWLLEAIPAPEPEPPGPTAAEIRRAEILGRLAAIDLESIRALRAKNVGKGGPFEDTKLATLDTEAVALRAELAGL